ncbi:hypothetical protein O3M35_000485 [Rhynocoris fuscipes]|uniref:Uncharacterized protein n=1 Tax=Rhynocoris fuscipes TaxID=488301 RepID=A0AAW1DPN9_9HEMI
MKLYLLLLAMLVGTKCDEAENTVDIGQTVKEVESILAEDPNLPRLTRGEIVTLIEEVRNGKDLMVVLPQQFNTTLEGEVKTTKRPKRRRKPIRPVYIHSTTTVANNDTTATSPSTTSSTESSSSQQTEDWLPKFYITPQKFTTTTPVPTTLKTTTPQSIQNNKPDVSVAAESLSPDMKELLSSFGLLGGPVKTTSEIPNFMIKSMSPTVDPSSYSRFKPLPSTFEGMSPDMQSFLAAYGLLDSRQAKSKQTPAPDPLEHLPNKDILEDLGLRQSKKLNQHVFNPNSIKNSTEELHKVNKILMKLREFSEGNGSDLNEDEVKELLLIENNTKLTSGEDPIDSFQSLENKTEVKRQQPNDTEAVTTTTESSAPSSADGNTEATVSPGDLADSFGGAETSTRRPNGFYFLLDWNSFLDVGLPVRRVKFFSKSLRS